MGVRRVIGGFSALALTTLAGQVLGFVILAVAARRLGPSDLGAFAFAVNLSSYFAIPANFGVTALALRDVGQQPERAREIAGEVLVLQTSLSLVPYALLVLLAPVLAPSELAQDVIPIIGATFVVDAVALWWLLLGRQRYALISIAKLTSGVLNMVLVLLFVDEGTSGTLWLAWALLASFVLNTVLMLSGAIRLEGTPVLRTSVRALARRFAASVPLGIAAVMISVYYTVDSVMLGYMKDTATVGQYAVAYKLPLAFLALAALWVSVLLPHASALWLSDREELLRQGSLLSSIALVPAIPLAAGALLTGHELMPAFFGQEFEPAGTPFILLTFAAALVAFTVTYGTLVIAIGDERQYAIGVTCGAVANVLANLVVIPAFGMVGAASTTIAAEAVVFAYIYVRLRRVLGPVHIQWWRCGRVIAATAVMVAVLLVVDDRIGVFAEVALGAAVFAVAAVPLAVFRWDEVKAMFGRTPRPQAVP
jgi:O-antigen/teichoic acid export membrane protein